MPPPMPRLLGPRLEQATGPVEVEADPGLRSRAEPHRSKLGGVRVHVVERDAETFRQLTGADQAERLASIRDELGELPCRGFGDRVDVSR